MSWSKTEIKVVLILILLLILGGTFWYGSERINSLKAEVASEAKTISSDQASLAANESIVVQLRADINQQNQAVQTLQAASESLQAKLASTTKKIAKQQQSQGQQLTVIKSLPMITSCEEGVTFLKAEALGDLKW